MLKLRFAFALLPRTCGSCSLLFAIMAAKAKHTAKTMATVQPKAGGKAKAKAVVRSAKAEASSGRPFAERQAMAHSLKDNAEKEKEKAAAEKAASVVNHPQPVAVAEGGKKKRRKKE